MPQNEIPLDSLRHIYSQSPDQWPKANVTAGVEFTELGPLPASPLSGQEKSWKEIITLGKTLFFDARLSGSNKISCGSCHTPGKNWSDGLPVAIGHDQAAGTRNTPSLENVWFYKQLFWDGRSESLEHQAEVPISNPIEMHQDLQALPAKLQKIKGYQPLFSKAFGDKNVTKERIMNALATFQKTIVSGKTEFDYFLLGDKSRMTDQQLLGLHLFRTKARCMNCHSGPLFTDGLFHNVGLTNYGIDGEDLGLYNHSKKAEDVGKFKTPSLRNVMNTGPWFHNGRFNDMTEIMELYNIGMPDQQREAHQQNDPMFPKNDRLLRGLMLSKMEKNALVAFLGALSSAPQKVVPPQIP